ncbi:MAG: hypothetical protein K6A40_01495 [Solobacterium sp.]|nr:hypothetical protein [Solobacterium sp.]
MKDYWQLLAGNDDMTDEEIFLKVRDYYVACLRRLYHSSVEMPDFRIYYSTRKVSLEEGSRDGYSVSLVSRRGSDITEFHVNDISEIHRFEECYTWFRDDVFVIFDYCDEGISPLQFITRLFFAEVYRQSLSYGIRHVNITHMYDILISGGVTDFFYGFYRLDLNFLHNLSAVTYERNYSDSRIIVPRYDDMSIRRNQKTTLKVAFEEPIPFTIENMRQIRKLLELSNDSLALVIGNSGKIIGLSDKHAFPDECEIRIIGHLSWRITYAGNKKISYSNARYHIHVMNKGGLDLKNQLSELDPSITPIMVSRIESVIREAAGRHGTILIVGPNELIRSETERLCDANTAIAIRPINVESNRELIPSFIAIDGAVMMDTRCSVYAIGAILDGDAVTKGSMARGSRFNSTLNYVHRRRMENQKFVGIVISEDGTVDCVTTDKVYRLNVSK